MRSKGRGEGDHTIKRASLTNPARPDHRHAGLCPGAVRGAPGSRARVLATRQHTRGSGPRPWPSGSCAEGPAQRAPYKRPRTGSGFAEESRTEGERKREAAPVQFWEFGSESLLLVKVFTRGRSQFAAHASGGICRNASFKRWSQLRLISRRNSLSASNR